MFGLELDLKLPKKSIPKVQLVIICIFSSYQSYPLFLL